MADSKETFKELIAKKTLQEIETMIISKKQEIGREKNLTTLTRLNSELKLLMDTRDQKLKEGGRKIINVPKTGPKPVLKSFEDYEKSKKQ